MTATPELPTPSPAARDRARALLVRALGDSKVRTDPEACQPFATDDSGVPGRVPDAVALATSLDDAARVLEIARETGVPVTPRAAGTGRTGGATAVAGGIVLSLLGMNRILEVDTEERLAIVEPGVITQDLHRAVEAAGLFYPPDPNSLAACTIGGNLAENAGGPRALRYGSTRDHVLGVEAALLGGQRFFAGRRTPKGVTGYDVTALLVGSEGTLAVLGAATLRLLPLPEAVVTLLGLFPSERAALGAVSRLLGSGVTPRTAEFLDGGTLDALRAAGNQVSPDARALLLVEVDGDAAAVSGRAERAGEALLAAGAIDVVEAREGAQRARLWAARRDMSYAVRRLSRHKVSEDVVVPRRALPELLDRVARAAGEGGIRALTYGHAGDGNLHVNYLWDEPGERARVERAVEQLFRDVVALGGTLSGEHGIGVLKAPYLPLEQPSELVSLQRDVKRAFDPAGLLNPGKIFPPGGHRAC